MTAFPVDWNISAVERFAEGIGGTVWRVRQADGSPAIAKRLSVAALNEASYADEWLREQDGFGAVRLLAVEAEWRLLEDAGDQTLAQLLQSEGDEAAARIAAAVLKRLHEGRAGAGTKLQPLFERLSALRAAAAKQGGPFAEAAALADRLLEEPVKARPLHGDFHPDNVLNGPRGWLAIDPHGVFGDPAYEAANWLYNPIERMDLRTDPKRARRMADLLAPAVGRSASAILDWAFCHACLSAAWHLEDGDETEAGRSLKVAAAIRRAVPGEGES